MSTNPIPPSKRAEEIIEKLPSSPSLITKTGTALLGTGLIAAAISQELYVVNEESIVLIASLIVFTYIGKVLWTVSERYADFSDTPSFYGRYYANLILSGLRVISAVSETFSIMLVLNILVLWNSVSTLWVRWKMSSPSLKASSPCQK